MPETRTSLPPPVPPPAPTPESDVTLSERCDQIAETKQKFSDVFKVDESCDSFPVDLSTFDNTINVKGRLHLPASIEFFEQ